MPDHGPSSVNPNFYNTPSLLLSPSNESLPDSRWPSRSPAQLDPSQMNRPLTSPAAATAADHHHHHHPSSSDKPSGDVANGTHDTSSTSSTGSRRDEPQAIHNHNNPHSFHSRGSSTTSTSSVLQNPDLATKSHAALNAPLSPEVVFHNVTSSSERPHSFSGGISQSDLRRLQNLPTRGQPPSPISTLNRLDGPRTSPPRDNLNETWISDNSNNNSRTTSAISTNTPPRFPSLGDQPTTAFPSIQSSVTDISSPLNVPRGGPDALHSPSAYQQSPTRNFPGVQGSYPVARTTDANNQYRPAQRTTVPAAYAAAPQAMLPPSSSHYMYPSQPRPPPVDRSHAPFGAHTQQQYFDLVTSPPPMRRDQQLLASRGPPVPSSPLPVYHGPPHTGVGDPSPLRNPASIAMLNGGIASYVGLPMPANGLYTPPPPNNTSPLGTSFPGFPAGNAQFYTTANYNGNDALANAMGRMTLSPSYQATPVPEGYKENDGSVNSQNGPSANNRKLGLYKTELCRSWEEKGSCRYGAKCQFAHSEVEIRRVSRHPKYKTEICRTFWVSGSCPYGKRCCFIHTELPASGAPPGADGSSPPKLTVGIPPEGANTNATNRTRSMSNASDGQHISLLQRISAQRDAAAHSINSPADQLSPAGYHFSKPPASSLRLDTSSLPGKTNYPLTSNPTLVSSEHQNSGMSPILPATAGPDFGRQAAARVEVVGYNNTVGGNTPRVGAGTKTTRDSQLRHSFNGTEMGLSIPSPVASAGVSPSVALTPITPDSANAQTPTGATGHQRAGSAGQWPTGSLNSRNASSTHLASPSTFVSNHNDNNNPWGLGELASNRKRLSGTWL